MFWVSMPTDPGAESTLPLPYLPASQFLTSVANSFLTSENCSKVIRPKVYLSVYRNRCKALELCGLVYSLVVPSYWSSLGSTCARLYHPPCRTGRALGVAADRKANGCLSNRIFI